MSTLEWSPHFRHDEQELAGVRVLAVKDRFAVLITPHGDSLSDTDHVRLALHYYARTLFELVRTRRSARRLPALIDQIVASSGTGAADVFAAAGVPGKLSHTLDEPLVTEANCVLYSVSRRDVHLWCDLSRLNTRQLVGSVLAVVQFVIVHIAPEMVDVLLTALENMNASYGVTHRYAEASGLDEVPANAFRAATFV
jgi:hypothetical protein